MVIHVLKEAIIEVSLKFFNKFLSLTNISKKKIYIYIIQLIYRKDV